MGLAIALCGPVGAAEFREATVSVDRVEADGVRVSAADGASDSVRLRADIRALDITFAPASGETMHPPRFRYRLEGHDREWRDPIGVMRFAVRFNDSSDNTISGEEFDAHGESPGWTGVPETSAFQERSETLDVPQGAARLQVWLSSAGPQQTMGVYALSELVVTLFTSGSPQNGTSFSMIPASGSLMDTHAGTPRGWARHGTSLGIAQIVPVQGRPPLLLMRDDRSDAFGGWLTRSPGDLSLAGVSKVGIRWREAYSVGWGGSARVSYPYPAVGKYRMRMQALTVEGRPQGEESVVRFEVVPPFHQSTVFRICLGLSAATFLGFGVRYLTRRRLQRRVELLESERAVALERSRIARDLHDNLGADLTHLALLSDLAQADVGDPAKARLHLDQIFETARSLTRLVDEMVWAVNPANDSVRGFVPFLSNYFQGYLQAAGISCRLDLPKMLKDRPISSAQRHHLLLTVKEALHNVVKHSGATEALLQVGDYGGCLTIRVQDNGRGIDPSSPLGDGTGNMLQRIRGIGGSFKLGVREGGGTEVLLTLPLGSDF
jgi:signal transduction histidine kinase